MLGLASPQDCNSEAGRGGIVTVLGLVGGAPEGETPRVADSSAASAGRVFHNSTPPSKQNRLGKPPEQNGPSCLLASVLLTARC